MSLRRRIVGISICLALLYLMTWGRPLVDSVIAPDSPIYRIGVVWGFGLGLIAIGLLMIRAGLITAWRGLMSATAKCATCGGTGRGSHYATREQINSLTGKVYQDSVLVNHCGDCSGTGTVYTGSWKRGSVVAVAGNSLVVIGLIYLGGWREFSARTNEKNRAAVREQSTEMTHTPIASDSVNLRQDRSPTRTSSPNILLSGKETESLGNVWEIRASLRPEGGRVQGWLSFKIIEAPPGTPLQRRLNSSAVMDVTGTLEGTTLKLTGTGVSDGSLIGTGKYELTLDKEAKTFSGVLANGGGTLQGTIDNWPGP